MFKSCRNLFDLSRKLGSVVIGLGLAGVLFAGQVSAVGGPRWSQSDEEHLANVVEGLVDAGRKWTWEMVAEQFNSLTNEERTSVACLNKWLKLARQDERYARIYTPRAVRAVPPTSWMDGDIEHLANVVRELVNSGRNWTWEMVAIEFNSRTSGNRSAQACNDKWCKLAEQNEEFRSIYNPKAIPSTPWTNEDIEHLADVVRELVNSVSNWTWKMVATEFNSQTNQEKTPGACRAEWSRLLKQNPRYREIYDPRVGSWTDGDKEHLADIVRELVRAGNSINWNTVAVQFNHRTNKNRTAGACSKEWIKLAGQDPHYRNIYDPTSNARSEAARRGWVSRNSRQFTQHEDESLMRLVQEHGERKWMRIAELLGNGRTDIQCKFRYRYLLQKNRNRVPIPQITTPITASGSQNAVNATDTSNAATQSRQVFPSLAGPFPKININFFLNG